MKTINIRCKNTGRTHKVPLGYNLEQVYQLLELHMPYGCTSATVNNKTEGLHYVLFGDKDVEFLDITSASGLRTYTRSLFFVLYKAVRDLYPDAQLRIDTPVSNGYYCHLDNMDENKEVTPDIIAKIKVRMADLIALNLPFHRLTVPTEEAIALFRSQGLDDKVKLLKSYGNLYTDYYTLGDTPNYFYGSLLVRTGQITLFDLLPFYDGILLRIPDSDNPSQLKPMVEQAKMFGIFQEQHRWQKILGVTTVGDLNAANKKGDTNLLISISEALQEKKISQLSDRIVADPDKRVILIAGPSSSGKTTFSKRLAVQLCVCGKKPVTVELDNYFVNREDTPLDEKGEYDFEHINAMNMALLNEQMADMLDGKPVELPIYNFHTGKSEKSGRILQIAPDSIVIFEGIHALNPLLTAQIDARYKFKIYASALTTMLLDNHNYIPTTDNRLLRRIVRDAKSRGYSAADTIRRWPSVRAGEEKWIFPFQEEADEMINTALLFELSALRAQALPLLEEVPQNTPEYTEAYRLRKFLSYLKPISTRGLPPTSLLREFLGGSIFK